MFTATFRADTSTQIGTGHVMHCLALADTFPCEEVPSRFISHEHSGHFLETIREGGHDAGTFAGANGAGADPEQAHAHRLGVSWQEDARLGFHQEGGLRKQLPIGDHPLDLNCDGRLRREWP